MTVAPSVDGARLWSSLMEMAEIGATPNGGCDRPSLSDADAAARTLFSAWATDAGCHVFVDDIANLFARLPGRTAGPVVLVGSHLDTQPTGGRFDGVYGVLRALEVIRTIRDLGITPERPIEIAVWTNEEGSRFPRSMLGSAVWSGAMPLHDALALTDDDGISVGSEIDRLGIRPTRRARVGAVAGSFELHIEQGPVLEADQLDIGVVTGVLGFRWYDLTLHGTPAHAGPTPMSDRRDPALAFADVVGRVHNVVDGSGDSARATFARISSEPPSHNTVPEIVRCTLDLRHHDAERLDELEAAVRDVLVDVGKERDVAATLARRGASEPVRFAPAYIDMVTDSAEAVRARHRKIISGAGHDSCHIASVAPAAMIFVPCEGGLSHNEAESITPEQCEIGASVLLGAVLRAAGADLEEQP